MYRAGTVATISLAIVTIGILRMQWEVALLGVAGVMFASYLFVITKGDSVSGPTIFSQVTLFAIGAILTGFSGLLFVRLLSEASDKDPNIVILIGGFILLPMVILMGIAMMLCSLFSRRASHDWLMYLATEPSRYNEKLF